MQVHPLKIFKCGLLVACLLGTIRAGAQDTPQAFVGAHIIPIAGDEIPEGTLIVQDGRIVAVGPSNAISVPENAERHDASGFTIMPGLVDTHSHIAGVEGGDGSAPLQPDVRVLDAINVRDARVQKAQAGGVTTANIMSGSGHLLSGQTVYLKLRDGTVLDDLLLYDAEGNTMGGIKMANGTNSRRNPPFPGTRAKSAALVREQFIKAQEYQSKVGAAEGDPEKMPERDLMMEALVEVLEGTRVVHHHTHRHDDIITVLRLSEEFGFRVVLHHLAEGWRVAEQIAAANTPASIILVDSPGGKLEALNTALSSGAALEQAGVMVGFHTDDGISDSRLFLRQAGLAVRAGMSREGALYGLTMAGARMLDLDGRIGTLEGGKDADFILLSGDPLSVYTKVLETWVDGVKVFDRSDPKDLLYATGGYGASHDQQSMNYFLEIEGGY